MQTNLLLPIEEKMAFDVFMKGSAVTEGNEYGYLVFEASRGGRICASNGMVLLELMPAGLNMASIEQFVLLKKIDGEKVPFGKNVHIPYKYILMMNGLSMITLEEEIHKSGEVHIGKIRLTSPSGSSEIRIDDFILDKQNSAYLEKPSFQKDLFGKDDQQQVKFVLAKYKETFDKVLKKLDIEGTFSVGHDNTTAIGTTLHDFEYRLCTKTPLAQS